MCKQSAPDSRQITTPLNFYRPDALPGAHPTVQSTEGIRQRGVKCKPHQRMPQHAQTIQSNVQHHECTVQRHQSAERPILRQISSLICLKIHRRQVIMNVLHPGCVQLPQWSPPVLWRRFEDGRQVKNIMPATAHPMGHNTTST